MSRRSVVILILLLVFAPAALVWGARMLSAARPVTGPVKNPPVFIGPTIPDADRNLPGRVFLEHADQLHKFSIDSFIVVSGNVEFTKGPMVMLCDSAHYFPATESLFAFGNVTMKQGDTLFIYADELNYFGDTQKAYLYGSPKQNVRMINRDVKLETPVFTYDMRIDLGYYTDGGVLTDTRNRLESKEGDYIPSTKEANFYKNVHLTSHSSREGLEIFTDTLYYNANTHISQLYSDSRIVTGKTTIYTDYGRYNTDTKLAELMSDSRIVNGATTVYTSYGTYNTGTRIAKLLSESRIVKGETVVYTNNGTYNTTTHLAELFDDSRIEDPQGTIFTNHGTYNTETEVANLYGRSKVQASNGNTLTGDRLFYDRRNGYGEAFGNMELVERKRMLKLTGDYGYYNEITDSAFAGGKPLAVDYSRPKRLYIHGAEIRAFLRSDTLYSNPDTIWDRSDPEKVTFDVRTDWRMDTTHVVVANPRVRYYREDVQGICDSLSFEERDTTLYMYYHPIVWSDDRQIAGNLINVHLRDSVVDHAIIPQFGISAQHVEEEFYDQISGREMEAWFTDGELNRLNVRGNVQAIMLPEENDSTYNKLNSLESSYLEAWFEKRKMQRLKSWPESTIVATPLYLSKRSQYYLPMFQWYESLRPRDPEDVFNISPEMDQLMQSPPLGGAAR